MAVYHNRARDIVERLILLRDYIQTNASPTRAVKAKDMIAYLERKGFGKKDRGIDVKTLYADLDMLEICFSDIKVDYDKKQKGYVLNKTPLSSYDLRLIVNSVQAAQFITQEEADRLTDKLIGLADEYTKKLLDRRTLVANRVRTMNDRLMKNLDIIYEAIAQNKKIRYQYFKYALIGHKRKEYEEINGSKLITASPYSVVWKEEKFWAYVIVKLPKDVWNNMYFGCDDEGEENEDFECDDMDNTKAYVYDFFPLDVGRMEDITICPEDREGENIYRKYSGISSEANKLSTKKTKLKASNIYLTDVMDMFGESVSIIPAGRTFFFATITEELTPELYIWTRQFSPPIEIVAPQNAEEEMKKYFSKLIKDDDPNVKLMREVFEAQEEFLSLK